MVSVAGGDTTLAKQGLSGTMDELIQRQHYTSWQVDCDVWLVQNVSGNRDVRMADTDEDMRVFPKVDWSKSRTDLISHLYSYLAVRLVNECLKSCERVGL